MPRLPALAILLAALLSALPAAAGRVDDDGPQLSDDSRWLSFVRLVESRWRVRTQAMGDDGEENRKLLHQCVDDAWFLALPSLVDDRRSPCAALVEALQPTEHESAKKERLSREEYRTRFTTGALAPTREQFVACTTDATEHADPEFLAVCALALRPRASLLASLGDQERFRAWLSSCKKSMLGDLPKAGETAHAAAHSAAEDEQARHCFRTLPTLYEVQGLKKLSDFWTPEELRALNVRSRQLGQN